MGGLVYHVLNRAVGRSKLFRKEKDYVTFEKVLEETRGRTEVRILNFCLMPTHGHLVLWPREDGQLCHLEIDRVGNPDFHGLLAQGDFGSHRLLQGRRRNVTALRLEPQHAALPNRFRRLADSERITARGYLLSCLGYDVNAMPWPFVLLLESDVGVRGVYREVSDVGLQLSRAIPLVTLTHWLVRHDSERLTQHAVQAVC